MARMYVSIMLVGEGMNLIGKHITELDTPSLLVDLDKLKKNIKEMSDFAAENKLKLRPHIKTHKSIKLAQMQLDAGAGGITCAKISEAEVMAAAGIKDILIAYPISSELKIKKLMKLLGKNVNVKIAVDHVEQLFQVLPQCDYVVVTLPLTSDTYQLFGRKQFEQMKPTACFINIGRGEIVIENELIEALQTGKIGCAGLDVFETEPLSKESPLWEMENVIITPHTSGATEYYNQRVIETIFIPNLKTYLEGNTPTINLVDYKKGY